MESKRGIKMINIAVCDDEKIIVSQIESIILDICRNENIPVGVDGFYSGETLEKEILRGTKYDLLYLDIQLKEEDGITTAKNIRKMDENVLIIYVSVFDKYMMELFRLDVFDFIKKPIELESFKKTFLEANQKISSRHYYYYYRYKGEEYKIPCNDILYFESGGRQVRIVMRNGDDNLFNGKLSEVENKLANGKIAFLRIHQSYLVNYHAIRSRKKSEITLINEKILPISEDRRKVFSQKYVKLLGGEIDE